MDAERAETRPPIIEVYRAIIFNENGEILLGQRSVNDRWNPLSWEVPGGKREPDQTPTAALVSEILQETGLIIVPSRLIYEEEIFLTQGPRAGKTYKLQVCAARAAGGTFVRSKEHDDFCWITPQKALTLELTSQTRAALLAFLELKKPASLRTT
ncbi:MAG: NUDIX domain-containing protein [Candidatus Blackburnbacteria bacterium]|nr:NUDIX domain-containing protein [Candidatus Blackburnbacteria bacterium]